MQSNRLTLDVIVRFEAQLRKEFQYMARMYYIQRPIYPQICERWITYYGTTQIDWSVFMPSLNRKYHNLYEIMGLFHEL